MSQPSKPDLVTVNIDGRDVQVPKGTNIIEAASKVGVEVPHYCYHPKLSIVGNCRMCLVEMGMPALDPATRTPLTDPATGKPMVNWIPRPQIGCATYASPGMHIRTDTPLVKDCREGVMEFLLVNHPLDCPICDQAGECSLQEFATGYGRGYSRFVEQKNVKPKRTVLGPRVTLDDERCILCSRCIRFCKEVPKDDVLGFIDRGSYSTLTCYPGKKLENNYSLNTVDICPVGALTSTDFRFKMRVWFLKTTPSICTESSAGTNTEVWSREGTIYRITPRRNDAVNDTWMTDSGRELYKLVESADRLREAAIGGITASLDSAIKAAADILSASDNRKSQIENRKSAVAIVGLLYAKDLLRVWHEGATNRTLRDLIRPACFVPEAISLDKLLADLQQQRIHMAIVVDEYGGTAGLVTLEDIVEEIVGEIRDEYDAGEEAPYLKVNADEYLFDGGIDIDDVNDLLDTQLPTDAADTLGGYIYDRLGRVPSMGDQLMHDGLVMEVQSVLGRRIRKVRVKRLPPPAASEQDEAESNHKP